MILKEYQINDKGLTLIKVSEPYEMMEAIDIRYKVFCLEQNVPYELEMVVEEEKISTTFIIRYKNKAIGTIRYCLIGNDIKLQRFAFLYDYRKNGFGKDTFKFVSDLLMNEYKPNKIFFEGQAYLEKFYENLGFTKIGEEFMEAGIKHFYFEKKFIV